MGAILGVLWVAGQRVLAEAQAVLFFPPPLTLADQAPKREKVTDLPLDASDPGRWARELLTSKEAVDMICKRIERTESDSGKAQTLRSAVLLSEGDRIRVETLPSAAVRLRVRAETPRAALLICEGLVAYLNFKSKIPLEDPEADKLVELQQQLRIQEKSLGKSLWSMMAFGGARVGTPPNAEALEVELQDYRAKLAQYQTLTREHFFRQTHAAAGGPAFVVLEPAGLLPPERHWLLGIALGGGLGFLLSLWIQRSQKKQASRKNVRWRVQEGRYRDRTAPPA